jgi:hypothetical protein
MAQQFFPKAFQLFNELFPVSLQELVANIKCDKGLDNFEI